MIGKVSVNGSMSDLKKITYGMPQGSILGPLLFLLFIKNLLLYMDNVNADLYADDTTGFQPKRVKITFKLL